MPCIPLGGGGYACSRGRGGRRAMCSVCKQREAAKLCDFPLRGRRAGKTCDAKLCDGCAVQQPVTSIDGDTVDFCPPHDRLAKQRGEQLSIPQETP